MRKFICCLLIIFLLTGCLGLYSEDAADCAPPLVMVDGHLYWIYDSYEYLVDAPDEELWAGTITSIVPYNRAPTENDQTNQECCLNQPYAFINGQLVVYMENIPLYKDGNLAEYNFDGWFKCKLYE